MPLAEIVDRDIVQEWAEGGDEASARFLKAASRCPNPLFGVADDEVVAWFDGEAAADAWLLEALVDSEVESLDDGELGVVLDPSQAKGARPGPGTVWVAWDSGQSGWVEAARLTEPEE
jgi:hypothetical protein